MIKQDYLVRMIQEIISAIARAILNKKKIRQQDLDEYDLLARQMLGFPVKELATMDVQELIDRYQRQMHYYSQALERAYGKKVKECYLYSFALGKAVAVEV